MEKKLIVLREIAGTYEVVGTISPTENGAEFSYSDSYLASSSAQAISTALPLASTQNWTG